MTNAELADELEGLAKLAARGEWRIDGPSPLTRNPNMGLWEIEGESHVAANLTHFDAALIVALVNRLPAIISALRSDGRMREGVAEALYQLEHVMGLTVKSEAAYQHNITLAIGSLKALSESDNDQDR